MPRPTAEKMTSDDVDHMFKKKYKINKDTGCWIWQSKIFRFRHGASVLNPRRYAAHMKGYVIPQGRNVYAHCKNPLCINPQHTRTKHDGLPISQGETLYLEREDMHSFIPALCKKYHASRALILASREKTLELIQRVNQLSYPINRFVNEYRVGPSYIAELRTVNKAEFDQIKRVPDDPDEDENMYVSPNAADYDL